MFEEGDSVRSEYFGIGVICKILQESIYVRFESGDIRRYNKEGVAPFYNVDSICKIREARDHD